MSSCCGVMTVATWSETDYRVSEGSTLSVRTRTNVIVASAVQREMKSVAVCKRVCDNSAMKWCNCDMILLLNAHCYMYKSKREKVKGGGLNTIAQWP